MDTIFALSSGRPPAGIGIIRVSGPAAQTAALAVIGRVPRARRAALAQFVDSDGAPIDHGVMLFFPGPGSATGEDCVEFHCHGGRAVVDALLARLDRLPGLRPAVAGEFTRRAFTNGRIDLNEADGLADLLAAETQGQRRAALAMAEGGFSARVGAWEATLLQLSAMAEAALDFSDEDDVPDANIGAQIAAGMRTLADDVRAELKKPVAERLREGIRVVIAGPPNAGKSTLLNALVGREAAIVSDIAGTTRDRIEVPCAIGGYPFLLTDTAGLRDDSDDAIEQIGMGRARDAIAAADIVLWLGDDADAPVNAMLIAAQCDKTAFAALQSEGLRLSALTGEGMPALIAMLVERAGAIIPTDSYALNARQRASVSTLAEILADADVRDGLIVAEQLRLARREIDALTGRAGTEGMLDALFGRFCIGK